jgi:hypothetical protein
MRRLVFICLLQILLPVEGIWSTLASLDLHDVPCAVCSHLAQRVAIDVTSSAPGADVDGDGDASGSCCDPNCPGCSGHGMPALICLPWAPGIHAGDGVVARNAALPPDHLPDRLLRPPLAHAA